MALRHPERLGTRRNLCDCSPQISLSSREEAPMQIERVWSQVVRLPADEPLADGKTAPGATRDIVVVKVATKDGIEGLGATFFGAGMTGALKVAAEELGALAVGEDPHRVERIAD